MKFYGFLRRRAVIIASIFGIAVLAVFAVREVDEARTRLPIEVAEKIRNLSAQEIEWEIATTAVPGDVLEHFVLVRLAPEHAEAIRDVRVQSSVYAEGTYRAGSLASVALGIGESNADERAGAFFNEGITLSQIAPGEFIDLKWQTHVAENIAFGSEEAPLLESAVTAFSGGFSPRTARAVATLSSTLERGRTAEPASHFYLPKVFGMNPRSAYEDLGTGVVVAGDDLEGVKGLYLAETGKALAWRLVSNDLLEAGIPAGLLPGTYSVAFVNAAGETLRDALSFEILPSKGRAVIVAATPSVVAAGQKRTIVLQGIRLTPDAQFALRENKSKQVFALENAQAINQRVLTAEVPGALPAGAYTLLVGGEVQEVRLTVN